MPYEVYKVIHIFGILMLFTSLGGVALHGINGGDRESLGGARKLAAASHGVAMFLILFGGFGLMARLGISHSDLAGWVIAKLGIWVLLGGAIAVLLRKPQLSKVMWFLLPAIGGVAAWIAVTKPF